MLSVVDESLHRARVEGRSDRDHTLLLLQRRRSNREYRNPGNRTGNAVGFKEKSAPHDRVQKFRIEDMNAPIQSSGLNGKAQLVVVELLCLQLFGAFADGQGAFAGIGPHERLRRGHFGGWHFIAQIV